MQEAVATQAALSSRSKTLLASFSSMHLWHPINPTHGLFGLNTESNPNQVLVSLDTLGLNFRWSLQQFVRIFWWRAPPKGGRGHPLTVHHYTKDHLCSIIHRPIRREEYDTLQMILGILGHHGAHLCRLSGCNNLQMWLPQHGSLRSELYPFVANSECHLDPVCEGFHSGWKHVKSVKLVSQVKLNFVNPFLI